MFRAPASSIAEISLDALKAGRLAGAAMDLCDPLPVSMTDPMLDAPRTVLTPHMAWQTAETFCRAAAMLRRQHFQLFYGEPSHVANPDALKGISRVRPLEGGIAPNSRTIFHSLPISRKSPLATLRERHRYCPWTSPSLSAWVHHFCGRTSLTNLNIGVRSWYSGLARSKYFLPSSRRL